MQLLDFYLTFNTVATLLAEKAWLRLFSAKLSLSMCMLWLGFDIKPQRDFF